jgi:hypothetical protein
MIRHLDNLLRHLFMAQINEIADKAQACFQQPERVGAPMDDQLSHDQSI